MTKTMLTATIAHAEAEATGSNDKGTWTRSSVILAPENADMSGSVSVIEADTFAEVPAVGSTVRVVIEDRKRIVGQNVYENKIVTRFIPVG